MSNKIRASHILVKTEDMAKEIANQIKAGGSFAKLAQENSLCPSKKRGGDLGEFGRGKMVKEFEKAAFALQKDAVSGPVKTQFGWHIIKRTK